MRTAKRHLTARVSEEVCELLAAAMAARGVVNRSEAIEQAIREWGQGPVEEAGLRAAGVSAELATLQEMVEEQAGHVCEEVERQAERIAKMTSRNQYAAEMVYALVELLESPNIEGIPNRKETRARAVKNIQRSKRDNGSGGEV